MLEAIVAVLIGTFVGASGTFLYGRQRKINQKSKIDKELETAKNKAADMVLQAKDEAIKIENERRKELKKIEVQKAKIVSEISDGR